MAERRAVLRGQLPASVRWNFAANVADGALYSLALSFVSQQTVLPVFVKNIGGGNVAVGLIPVLMLLGFNFPQVAVAGYAQRQPWKKRLLLRTALGQRIPWLVLAILTLVLFPHISPGAALLVFFAVLTLGAVGGSLNLPVWFDLVAKLTPVNMRGRLFGARSVLGSLLGIGGGAVASVVLAELEFPENYALLLALAFATTMVSYVFLMSLREDEPSPPSPAVSDFRYVLNLPEILRTHHAFRNFLVADALLMSSTMGAGFYTIFALHRFSLSDAYAGGFTVIMMVGGILGSFAFGFFADRSGHRVNLRFSAAATAGACALALGAGSVGVYSLVFICTALATAGMQISRLPFLAEIAPERERPSLIALANLVTSPFVLLGVAAGWIADHFGYHWIFVAAGLFALASLAWLQTMVPEPRHTPGALDPAPVKEIA